MSASVIPSEGNWAGTLGSVGPHRLNALIHAYFMKKSLAVVQDEQEMVRRERMAIEEIRELLTEMHQDAD